MAKKLAEIEEKVKNSSSTFYEYLMDRLSTELRGLIGKFEKQTDVFVFSGVIRNFFLKNESELRDLDLVLKSEIDFSRVCDKYKTLPNSFGGHKVLTEDLTLDIWVFHNTWGLNHHFPNQKCKSVEFLPNTTFFNFSSVLYSLREKQFIVGKPFLRFLRDKEIDIVLEQNPSPALCIVSSFYYSDKYELKLSNSLKRYIRENYMDYDDEFELAQKKHFSRVIYSRKEILDRINLETSDSNTHTSAGS